MTPPAEIKGRVHRYRLVRRMAAGGMADIHLAQIHGPRGYERTVVVKTIRSDLVEDDELAAQLMQEARFASCLRHDNIVELIEVGESDGTRFLAMEFAFGQDIRRIRERCEELGTKVPYRHAVTILADVLDALAHAHHDAEFEGRPLQLIHRDVSPQNILVGFDGNTKLLDFGLAKGAVQLSRTRTGVLKGKYAYMSPEQVLFKGIDHRSDLFAVGVVLWELLTSRRLFVRANDYETVQAVIRCRVPFARAVRRSVPWQLAWVALRALRRSPRWRYRTASAMRSALLRSDSRSRAEARNELADWLAQLFHPQLHARESVLARMRHDPPRFRQVRDAGFELLDEPTDPSLRRVRAHPSQEAVRPVRAPSGVVGVMAAAVGTWRWYLVMMASSVLFCAGLGVYLGSQGRPEAGHGYLYVFADETDVEVTVGATKLGRAPIQRVPVLPGVHRVTGASRRRGITTVSVSVEAGENRVVTLMFPVEPE